MTDISFTFETAGNVEVMLRRLERALEPGSLGEFLDDEVVPHLQMRAMVRFRNEGDDVVGNWAPLAASTRKIRAAAGYAPDRPINKRTGDLERYITGSQATSTRSAGGAGIIYPGRGEADSVITKKMETAQKGRGKPKTPARPVLGLGEVDLPWTLAKLQTTIQRAVG